MSAASVLLAVLLQPALSDGALDSPALETYVSNLKRRIIESWQPPAERKAASCLVSFTVSRDGTIAPIEVTASSGDPTIDASAVRTIQSLSPAKPLPPQAPPAVTIDLRFQYLAVDQQRGEPELAVERKEQLVREKPQDPKAAFEYGRALRFAGHLDQAAAELNRAIALGFTGVEPEVELAAVYKKQGKTDEAEQILRQTISSHPEFTAAYRLLGDILYEQRRWQEAESTYKELLRVQPTGPLSDLASARIQVCRQQQEGLSEAEE